MSFRISQNGYTFIYSKIKGQKVILYVLFFINSFYFFNVVYFYHMKYSKFIYRLSQGNASRVFQGGGNRRHGGQLRRGGAASLRPHGHGGGRALAAARRGFAGSVSLNLNPRLSAATKFSEAKKSCVYSYSELLFENGPDFLDTKLETYPVLQCVACY